MADDLVTRLRAELDETERIALAAIQSPWHTGEVAEHLVDYVIYGASPISPGRIVQVTDMEMAWQKEENAAHIIRNEPAAVLRMVAAHRKILDEIVDEANGLDISVDIDRRVGPRDDVAEPLLGNVLLRILAEAYGIEP